MVRALPVIAAVLACMPGFAHAQTENIPATGNATEDKDRDIKDGEDGPAIVVTARKGAVTNAIDRRIYDISTRPDAAFSSATDVLTRIPSVTVDPLGRIALRGDGQVKILIDGIEARPGAVASLQASEIERIEVMTNPSGQFASDGSGGIINIVLKKKREDGLSGIVSLRSDDEGRYGAHITFNRKSGRWTLSGYAGFSSIYDIVTYDGIQNWATTSGIETTNGFNRSETGRRQAYEYASLGYALSSNDKIELSYSQYRWRAATHDDGMVATTNALARVVRDHAEVTYSPDRGNTYEWTLHFNHKGAVEGEQFDVTIARDEGEAWSDAVHQFARTVPSRFDAEYTYLNASPDGGMSIKGDYERPFGTSRLTAGFLFDQNESRITSQSDNIAAIVPGEADYNIRFDYERRTAAGYITWQTALGKWGGMPGLRVETEQRQAGVVTRNEQRFLPSLSLERPLSERTKLVASYSRRTQSPNVYQLNPRRIYWSRYFVYEGNPQLSAQETDAVELGYEFTGNTFSSNGGLYYRVNHDPLMETRRVASDQTVIVSIINAGQSRAAGLEWSAKGKVSKTLDYSVNLNVFDSEVSGLLGGEMLKRQYVTWSGNAVVEYKPNTRDWVQFSLNGEGRGVALQGYRTGFYRIDMLWRHKLTPKWTASLRALDLLNSSKQTTVFTTPEGQSTVFSRTERPALMVAIARKFGNDGQ